MTAETNGAAPPAAPANGEAKKRPNGAPGSPVARGGPRAPKGPGRGRAPPPHHLLPPRACLAHAYPPVTNIDLSPPRHRRFETTPTTLPVTDRDVP